MTLAELRALCDAATPGPWYPRAGLIGRCWVAIGPFHVQKLGDSERRAMVDAELIAAARTALPKLLAVAEAAKAIGCRGSEEFNPEWIRLSDALAALEAP